MDRTGEKGIKPIVDSLVKTYSLGGGMAGCNAAYRLDKAAIVGMVDIFRQLLFPGYFGRQHTLDIIEYHTGSLVEDLSFRLCPQIGYAVRLREGGMELPAAKADAQARELTFAFLSKLATARNVLLTDVEATFNGDPAAFSQDEIISSYPGIYAIMVNRLAHELYLLDVPMIPRILTEHAHSLTGIDIHPGATIGHHFFIDHGTGIVIGETTLIGNYVKIYQGVTLGALSPRDGQALRAVKRHPTIEDNVTIYSGASILGGDTVIGEGTIIGSNVFLTKSVPRSARVRLLTPELQIKMRNDCENCEDAVKDDCQCPYSITNSTQW